LIRIKGGVDVGGLRAEIVLAICIASNVFEAFGVDCVITSVFDGVHKKDSLHDDGLAVDLRTRDLPPASVTIVAAQIRACLWRQYQVVVERDHMHIEFDPKQGGAS
jgi:hypothetical protein